MGGWISVKERLPEQGQGALVFVDLLGYRSREFAVAFIAKFGNETWWEDREGTVHGVTHWMPLPAPPDVATSKNGDVAVPGLSERLADNAVKALRKRIPEERPSGDGPLWPSSMKRGML